MKILATLLLLFSFSVCNAQEESVDDLKSQIETLQQLGDYRAMAEKRAVEAMMAQREAMRQAEIAGLESEEAFRQHELAELHWEEAQRQRQRAGGLRIQLQKCLKK